MQRKILVLDIDGTLTNSKKEITPATKNAIIGLMKRGHSCMLASGRPTPGMEVAASTLEFEKYGGYLLSFNGARIIKYDTQEIVYQRKLDKSYIPELYAFAVEHGCGIITYHEHEILSGNGIDQYVTLESRINRLKIKELENFPKHIDFDVNKCLMTAPPEEAEIFAGMLNKQYKNRLSVYRSEPYFIEIMPLGVDKASSLDHMLPYIGLKREDVVACGDGFNDITMIKYAGTGVAMANAQKLVKEIADEITLSNDEDGLVPVIEKYFL